jgi:chemotaxis protein methyltransferase CheR
MDSLVRFQSVLARQLGWHSDPSHDATLRELLAHRAAARRTSADDYLALLEAGDLPGEVSEIARDLTITETYFFRYADQWRALSEQVVPSLGVGAGGTPLRVLSAGCSSGEEPYTIAMVLDGIPAEITAVDIDPSALRRAAEGRYSRWALRETPRDARERWFECQGSLHVLDPALRQRVAFSEANLADPEDPLWRQGPWDVVFCRNVLMYLTPAAAASLVRSLATVTRADGALFLGHAETLRGLSTSFQLVHTHDSFHYRRLAATPGDAAPARPTAVASRTSTPAVDDAGSWLAAIQLATDRIRALTTPRPAVDERAGPEQSWDLSTPLALVGEERFEDALEALQDLPGHAQDDPDVLLLRAVSQAHHGATTGAASTCRQLLAVDPLHAGAHYVLGLCAEAAGDLDDARAQAEMACHLDPSFAMPHLLLALVSRRAGDTITAGVEFATAAELFRSEEPARILLFGGGFGRDALVSLCRGQAVA